MTLQVIVLHSQLTCPTQCDQTVTLTQFFEDIVWSNPPKVGFIGAGCENATIETAKISYFFNLTQVCVAQGVGVG